MRVMKKQTKNIAGYEINRLFLDIGNHPMRALGRKTHMFALIKNGEKNILNLVKLMMLGFSSPQRRA